MIGAGFSGTFTSIGIVIILGALIGSILEETGAALKLAGCSNTSWRKSEVLAVPLQPTLQQEVILARMEQILASRALN